MSTSDILLREQRGAAAILTLNRVEKHNSLSGELLIAIAQAVRALDEDPSVRGIVIAGQDDFFSTGADLNEALAATELPKIISFLDNFRNANSVIESSRKPVIAAICGYCLTGGLELALACDLRFAGDNAQFGITSAKIGSVAGAGGTQRLARLIGSDHTKDLLFSARFIDAQRAYDIGLVTTVLPRNEVLDAAIERIEEYAKQAPLSVWLSKIAINIGQQLDLESSLVFEQLLTAAAFGTQDRKEGMSAFLEKRKAKFTGA
ncbi:enoyl-CoA hydratase/isomerase family protein [Candidatus Nitrotoga sp. M5]|uniref:enoyl-CoA hydratase/isomerase family protein n=1 Tax=Candidatus Nitrotoga sp. M5 TaxID=2890409 RepID=UPI001EF4CE1E|nr:enoyl-CoA hydratase/isomerase family protein [Candidatus Nitrotoga sp. M5]CAH1387508.1 Crotonyl-CoA hydratase [Candidatus Nitrotoga sp. M5]